MKHILISGIIFLLSLQPATEVNGQNCRKFHLYGACMQYPGPVYKIDGQSRSNSIGFGDKLIYSVVLYGERNYKFFFCATTEFNPVHFVMRDGESGTIIYDNSADGYPETIVFNVEQTRNIKIEIAVLAKDAPKDLVAGFIGCSGMLVYWRPVKKPG